jgi:hypothetical protein
MSVYAYKRPGWMKLAQQRRVQLAQRYSFAIQFGEQYCYKDRKTAFEKQAATKSNQRNKSEA